jgi:hypothetical protein
MKTLNLETKEGAAFFQKIITAYSNYCLIEESTAKTICLKHLHHIAEWQMLGFPPGEIATKIQAKEHPREK